MHPRVTFLIGENGSGKSTLLEAIAVRWGFNAEGGSRNFRFSTRDSHSELANFIQLVKGAKQPVDGFFLRAESYFNLGTQIERLDEDEEGVKPANQSSVTTVAALFTSSRTASRSSPSSCTASAGAGST